MAPGDEAPYRRSCMPILHLKNRALFAVDSTLNARRMQSCWVPSYSPGLSAALCRAMLCSCAVVLAEAAARRLMLMAAIETCCEWRAGALTLHYIRHQTSDSAALVYLCDELLRRVQDPGLAIHLKTSRVTSEVDVRGRITLNMVHRLLQNIHLGISSPPRGGWIGLPPACQEGA
jgi:hypothetical protein